MEGNKRSRIASIARATLAAFLVVACSRGSDEQQIRELINAAETAAESRSTTKVMEFIAADYSDDLGGDKAQLHNLLRAYFLIHPKIELIVTIKDIAIEGPSSARVRLELSMVGTQQFGESTSLTAESQPLRIDLKRIDSKWRVVRVDRRRD